MEDCYFWNNNNIGFIPSTESVAINCWFFSHTDVAIMTNGRKNEFYNCHFGESPVATQNNGYTSKTQYSSAMFNDCIFADSTVFGAQNNSWIKAYSSNHNQIAGSYYVAYTNTSIAMESDDSVYRTSPPSLKLDPGDIRGAFVQHKIPIQVEGSTEYNVTIYGKKSATGANTLPHARIVGCGVDESGNWTTEDTNWNDLVLNFTPTRSGTILLVITVWDKQFNIDDISIEQV
jgi:hypothetical protein